MQKYLGSRVPRIISATLVAVLVLGTFQSIDVQAASSWNPTLLVNTEAFQTIDAGDGTSNIELQFGSSTTTLKFLYTQQKFQFNKPLSVLGTISGSSLNVDRNATVGGSLTATGAIRTKGNLSGATLNVDGDINLRGITYHAPTSQVANGVLKTDGNGTLTWGTATVGNGSGGIISLSPEYPNAIYFSSGSSFVGQLSASGQLAINQNFYRWTSTKGSIQDYWISLRVRVPDNFASWDQVKPLELRYRTSDGTATNNHVSVRMKDTTNTLVNLTITGSVMTGVTSTNNTSFSTLRLRGPDTSGTFTPGQFFTIFIKMAAFGTGKFADIGYLNLIYDTTTP